jgi:hypothetical protein
VNNLANGGRTDWRLNYVATVLTVFALYVVLKYAAVLVHEILGHGASALAFGGSFFAVYATPVSGYASLHLPGLEGWMLAVVLLAGIVVTGVLGLAALALARRANGVFKIALLLFAEIATMSSSLYLAYGGLRADGDPYAAMSYLGLAHNTLAPLGVILALGSGLLVSLEFSKADPFREPRPLPRMIGLWLPGIVMGIAGLSAYVLDTENLYAGLYGGTYLAAAFGGSVAVARWGEPSAPPAPVRLGTARQFAAVMTCLAVALYAWAAVFGATAAEARGIIIAEPPIEVESSYYDSFVGNARLVVHPNGSALLEFSMFPLNTNGTLLDKKILDTYADRPYLPDWESKGRRYTSWMLNLTANEMVNVTMSAELAGEVEAMNTTFANARTCTAWVRLPGANGSANATSAQNSTGAFNVTVIDPWASGGGYLDKLTVEWAGGMSLASYAQSGGALPDITGSSVTWTNSVASEAPVMVVLNFTR